MSALSRVSGLHGGMLIDTADRRTFRTNTGADQTRPDSGVEPSGLLIDRSQSTFKRSWVTMHVTTTPVPTRDLELCWSDCDMFSEYSCCSSEGECVSGLEDMED